MENKYKKILKNTFWILLGNTGSKILAFLLLPYYTLWLGTSGYGESDLISTYAAFLVAFMTLCVSDAIFIFTKNKSFEEKKYYFSSILFLIVLYLVLWMGIFILIKAVATRFNFHNSFVDNIWCIYGIVVSTFLQNYMQQCLISIDRMRIYSFTGIVLCFSTFFLSYYLLPLYGVKGYISAIIGANLITATFSFLFSKLYVYYGLFKFKWSPIREVLIYSIPLIPNTIIWWLVSAFNRPIMEKYLSFSEIGIYAVANRFPSVIAMVFGLLSVSVNVSMFEEFGKPSFKNFYVNIFRVINICLSLLALLMILFSEFIIKTFTSPDFHEAWKCMIIMLIATVFSSYASYFGTIFSLTKQSKYYLYSTIWSVGVTLVLSILMIKFFGIYGAAVSSCLSFMVMAFSRYIYMSKYLKTSIYKYIMFSSSIFLISCLSVLFLELFVYKLIVSLFLAFVLIFAEREKLKSLSTIVRQRLRVYL